MPDENQLSLLNPAESRRLTEEAIARVDQHADPSWKYAALRTLLAVARALPTFTPDDVWTWGLPRPREPRALGPVMRLAERRGWMEPTGEFVRSKIPTQHQNPIRVYRSLIYTGLPDARS